MKKLNEFLSVLLSLIMIISIIPMSTITASAEGFYYDYDDKELVSGDYEYAIVSEEDKTCIIEEYRGNDAYVVIPSTINGYTVVSIFIEAFAYHSELVSVTIPDSVQHIDRGVFAYCINLVDVNLGKGVTVIDEAAFAYCESLTDVTIPDNVAALGVNAFKFCSSLTTISIGKGVRYMSYLSYEDETNEIGSYGNVFSGCTSLEKITVDNDNLCYSSDDFGVLYNKDKTILLQYPLGNTRSNYTIPDSVISINRCSFMEIQSLTTITIGKGVTSIGYGTFYGCDSLTDVYYNGAEEQWNQISIDEFNDSLLNATIHFNSSEVHTHSYVTVVTPPTCTERGYTTYTCECGDSYIGNYVDPAHTPKTITIPATCTVAGMSYKVCEICGETIGDSTVIPATGHTAGEWEVVLEPTYEADGKKVKKCTVCGEIVAEEAIPMLVKITVTDEDTDVSIEVNGDDYDGVVDIVVEESFDGTAFDVIDTTLNTSQKFIYDITMTVDGEVVQPNGTVTVSIPLPDGYDPNRSFVYHVDTETGKVEKMPATYENGYLVFETTHFSYYAVVEEANYSFSIQSPSRTEIRNKDGIILHANVDGTAPNGSYVRWEANNGNFSTSADGSSLKIIANNKGYTTFTAILCDADGNELARDSVEMYSKSGFFDKIGGFFRSLFGTTKIYES